MSGVLAGLEFRPESAGRIDRPGDTRPLPGLGETFGASRRVEADRNFQELEGRIGRAYQPVIDALLEQGVDREHLFRGGGFTIGIGGDLGSALDLPNYETVWRMAKGLAIEGLPETRQEFEREAARRDGGRDADLDLLARGQGLGSTLAQFGGGMAGAMQHPVQLATLPLGGVGRNVARRILSEGLVAAGVEVSLTPGSSRAHQMMGEDYTFRDAAADVGLAFAGGAAFRGAIEAAPSVGRAAAAVDRRAYGRAAPVRERFDSFFQERDMARAFADAVPEHLRTPEQEAALRVLAREVEIDEASPYPRTYDGDDLHRSRLQDATRQVEEARIRPEAVPDMASVKRAIAGPESGGDDMAVNRMGSSASGRYQFIESTFKSLYSRVFGVDDAAASAAWNSARRFDVDVQERLMDRLLSENAEALRGAGVPATTGNLYAAHVLGPRTAIRMIRSEPGAPVSEFVSARAVEQNPTYLGGGRSVSEALAEIRARVGERGAGVPVDERGGRSGLMRDDEVPALRPEALDAERPFISTEGRDVAIATFRAADIEVDAELMQFKSGGDQLGVTDRLRGVEQWDPIAAGVVTVWEAQDGRRLIADGHQRLGLARRIEQAGGGEVMLNAFVLREADGFSARDARIMTALKNIGEGTGTATDAARVFREGGDELDDMIRRRLPPRSALVRDGKAIARLSDDAFGAVVNEVIPESHGAAIGQLAPDPATHAALVELLARTAPANRRQAEAMIRQGIDAGFTREVQNELFGAREIASSLFLARARLLDRTMVELRRLRNAFGVAGRNADALEAGGNRIDVARSEAEAADNARALALVELLALRKGNAVNALFDEAAARLEAGEPLAAIARDLVRAIRELDLRDIATDADRAAVDGRAPGGADSAGDVDGGRGRPGEPAGSSEEVSGPLNPAEIDELVAERGLGPSLFDDPASPASRAFDSDAGEGVRAAAESAWHDVRAQADDPNIAARQRQEAELGAAAPMRARAEQDGTMGTPLFDEADQVRFDLGDGGPARTASEIEAEVASDRAALDEIRKCL